MSDKKNKKQQQNGKLTGPMGIPAPPLRINRSASSSKASISLSSSMRLDPASDASGSSPVEPGGWTAAEVTASAACEVIGTSGGIWSGSSKAVSMLAGTT